MDQSLTATLAKNDKGESVIKIAFPYNFSLIQKVRSLPGRQYHPELQVWSTPVTPQTIEVLREWGFCIDPLLTDYLLRVNQRSAQIIAGGIPGLKGELYEFQYKGVAFIEMNKGNALIADEMGLGKTVQALAWLQYHPSLRPAIIVVPASLKLNWERETKKWLPNPKVEILSGTAPWFPRADFLIINYDVLFAWLEMLKQKFAKVLIADECHYFKSNNTRRTKAMKSLGKTIPHVICLSGTPVLNRPVEIFNALKIIRPELFPDYWSYVKRYCNAKHNGFGWDFNGATNMGELHDILKSTIMIRRLKADVLRDLPDKTYSFVPMELTNAKDYELAEADFVAYIRREKGVEAAEKAAVAKVLASIEGLKQLAVKGKLFKVTEWIQNFLEVDGKLVVFATHHFVIDHIYQEFGKVAVKYDGRDSQTDRDKAKTRFQEDPNIRLFIGNIQAAGVGITLTAASNVAFLELPWTPGALVQAEDRCHRIGQKDAVNIYYLLAENTIEERIAKLIDGKRKVLDAMLDGKDTPEESLLYSLIKSYVEEDGYSTTISGL